MRILHFYKSYYPYSTGGVEQTIQQITTGLSEYGVKSDILSLSSKKNETHNVDEMINVHFCKTIFEIASTPFSISAYRKFSKLVSNADIVHYHFPYPYSDVLHFLCNTNKPSIVTYHSDIVRQKFLSKIYSPLMKRFLGSVNKIIVTSPNYLQSSKVLDVYRNKVEIIPIGISERNFPKPQSKKLDSIKSVLKLGYFLFVGVLRYYKGLDILINAAEYTKCPIVIAGTGPLENELKLQVRKKNLKNIYFSGFVSESEKAQLYRSSLGVVFPSNYRSEAFGITLVEGLMYKKPLISCEIGTGTSYINQNNKTGFVVPHSDPIALANAMNTLFINPSLRNSMGEASGIRFRNNFTQKKMTDSYLVQYKALLK